MGDFEVDLIMLFDYDDTVIASYHKLFNLLWYVKNKHRPRKLILCFYSHKCLKMKMSFSPLNLFNQINYFITFYQTMSQQTQKIRLYSPYIREVAVAFSRTIQDNALLLNSKSESLAQYPMFKLILEHFKAEKLMKKWFKTIFTQPITE